MRNVATLTRVIGVTLAGFLSHGCSSAKPDQLVINGILFEAYDPKPARSEGGSPSSGLASATGTSGEPDIVVRASAAEPVRPEELPVEDLARALTPVVFQDGRAYRATRPPYEVALAIKEGRLLGPDRGEGYDASAGEAISALQGDGNSGPAVGTGRGPGTGGGKRSGSTKGRRAVPTESLSTKWIFLNNGQPWTGNDDRRRVDTLAYPYKTMPLVTGLDINKSRMRCSAVAIGRNTIITAAHCVYDTLTRAPVASVKVVYGINGAESEESGLIGNSTCVKFIVPQQWIDLVNQGNDREKWYYDFAVADVSACATAKNLIGRTGWSGYWVNAPDQDPVSSYGYPASGCGSHPCGMTGRMDITQSWRLETDNMDLTAGQSGGPWYAPGNYVIGVSSEQMPPYFDFGRCGFDQCWRNSARRLDTSAWNYVTLISSDY